MLHGPWESYDYANNLTDITSSVWFDARENERAWGRYADPTEIAALAFERNPESDMADYRLAGFFIVRNVLTEVIVNEDN